MYNVTRQGVAEMLGMSTRSVDRYIKLGKLRTKKNGKIILVNSDDIKSLEPQAVNNDNISISEEIENFNLDDFSAVKESNYEPLLDDKIDEIKDLIYSMTRLAVSEALSISTRSVDRYIRSGKLRSKKIGKIIFVNSEDVLLLKSGGKQEQEVIIPKKETEEAILLEENKEVSVENGVLDTIYSDLRQEINKKDELINALSVQIGRIEEVIKNSISLSDFKKSQYLLEESKFYLSNEVEDLRQEKKVLEQKLKYEKISNILLIFFTLILLSISATVWFLGV